MSVEVQFKLKSDTKVVQVNFFSEDYVFINHLKRCALEQIRGNVQKGTILNLINSGNFSVIKDNNTVYVYDDKNQNAKVEKSLSSVVSIVPVISASSDELDYLLNSSNIEEVCEHLDILEERSCKLHIRLQQLLGLEEEILQEKLALI